MKLIKKVKISLFISLFIILILNVKSFAVTGVVTEITVNVREKATTSSKRVMYVTQDDKVEVLEKQGDWYKIKYNNKTGYVLGKYIKVDDSKLAKEQEEAEAKKEEPEVEASKDVEKKLKVGEKTQIRIIPTISSSIIYTTSNETYIEIIEQIEGWTYISINNFYGWVRTDKITEENVAQTNNNENKQTENSSEENKEDSNQGKIAYIKYDTVNLRQKASTSSKSLAKLKLNDEVTILETVNSVWSKIKYEDITGYVSTELLSNTKQKVNESDETTTSRDGETVSRDTDTTLKEENKTTTDSKKEEPSDTTDKTTSNEENKSTTSVSKGEEIAEYAKKYLGYKYVSGGSSPKTGFDCSGFTYYVYKHFGYSLPKSSVSQANVGKKVDKSDLQPGDLVIYKNTSLTRIGHVGIYIGDNKMIHASEPGVGVIITDIDAKSYNYPKRYVMGRRVI